MNVTVEEAREKLGKLEFEIMVALERFHGETVCASKASAPSWWTRLLLVAGPRASLRGCTLMSVCRVAR
jgi:hypothetical protein